MPKLTNHTHIDYGELDKLIAEHFGKPIHVIDYEEWNNDSSYAVFIHLDEYWEPQTYESIPGEEALERFTNTPGPEIDPERPVVAHP